SAMEVAYQGTMRSALRDFDSEASVRVIVADLPTAQYLDQHIGSRSIQKIGDLAPEVRLAPLTQAQKDQWRRAEKNRKKLLTPKSLPKSLSLYDPGSVFEVCRNSNHSRCFVAFHNSPYDSNADQFVIQDLDLQ